MIEFDKSEWLNSKVEDSELIAVLFSYDHLPALEAIALKDVVLYGGHPRSHSPNVGVRSDLELGASDRTGCIKD